MIREIFRAIDWLLFDGLDRKFANQEYKSRDEPLPDADGRRFAWIDAAHYARADGQTPLVPVVLFDHSMCGEIRLKVLSTRILDPCEYGMSLGDLAAKYPPPPIDTDNIGLGGATDNIGPGGYSIGPGG